MTQSQPDFEVRGGATAQTVTPTASGRRHQLRFAYIALIASAVLVPSFASRWLTLGAMEPGSAGFLLLMIGSAFAFVGLLGAGEFVRRRLVVLERPDAVPSRYGSFLILILFVVLTFGSIFMVKAAITVADIECEANVPEDVLVREP